MCDRNYDDIYVYITSDSELRKLCVHIFFVAQSVQVI